MGHMGWLAEDAWRLDAVAAEVFTSTEGSEGARSGGGLWTPGVWPWEPVQPRRRATSFPVLTVNLDKNPVDSNLEQ